jgi:thioesterase domain-containing protein
VVTGPELQSYLHNHIPLTRAMQVSVVSVEPESVLLSAPLAPNINHRDTVFGGSAATLATLAAWSLVHTRLLAAGMPSRLVIQRNTMSYDQPIAGDFTARGFIPHPETWQSFMRLLERKDRARITTSRELLFGGHVVGRFEGDSVALSRDF